MQKHSNQHLKRKELHENTEFVRRKIRAGKLIARLNKAAAGKIDLSKSQLDSIKILLDKAVPSLQAIEQTVLNPMDQLSEDEIREQVRALITVHPWLLKEFAPGPQVVQPAPGADNTAPDTTQATESTGTSG